MEEEAKTETNRGEISGKKKPKERNRGVKEQKGGERQEKKKRKEKSHRCSNTTNRTATARE
jgi:hypothetical protein